MVSGYSCFLFLSCRKMALPVSRWTICLIFLFRVEVKSPSPAAFLTSSYRVAVCFIPVVRWTWPTSILVELSLQCGDKGQGRSRANPRKAPAWGCGVRRGQKNMRSWLAPGGRVDWHKALPVVVTVAVQEHQHGDPAVSWRGAARGSLIVSHTTNYSVLDTQEFPGLRRTFSAESATEPLYQCRWLDWSSGEPQA